MEKTTYSTPLVPRQIRLELSSHCNAKCLSCHGHSPLHAMTRPRGHMSRELVEKCLADIVAFPQPISEIVCSNYGETMCHPDWHSIMELVARKLPRVPIVFPTNGVLLADGRLELLCRIRTLALVNFSVNAYLKETYESFHGLPYEKSYETITNAITRLRQLRPDVTIWISCVRDSQYQSPREIELFKEHWGKYGIVQINQAEYSNRPDRAPKVPVTLPCRSLQSDLVILHNGQCLSCCYVADAIPELIVGDALTENLLDIWHGRKFSDLRAAHFKGQRSNLETCKRCTFA